MVLVEPYSPGEYMMQSKFRFFPSINRCILLKQFPSPETHDAILVYGMVHGAQNPGMDPRHGVG